VKQRELKFFRQLLTQQRQQLFLESVRAVEGMETTENFPDPSDRASLEANRNFTLRIRDRERKLILKIEDALARLENGNYGICERCGENISVARLKARPVATLCIDCKSNEEVVERRNSRLA
jgi:DnaK suppressor protein